MQPRDEWLCGGTEEVLRKSGVKCIASCSIVVGASWLYTCIGRKTSLAGFSCVWPWRLLATRAHRLSALGDKLWHLDLTIEPSAMKACHKPVLLRPARLGLRGPSLPDGGTGRQRGGCESVPWPAWGGCVVEGVVVRETDIICMSRHIESM